MFKKRRKRDRSHLKKKTLTELPVKKPEPEENPEKTGCCGDNDHDQDREDGSKADAESNDGEDVQISRKKKRDKKSLFIENTKKKIRELEKHSWKASTTASTEGAKGITVEVEKVERDITKPKWVGAKAPANVRIISRFDYQPDLCKDYSETGYCGYGDTCKFMHDRGDYKSGWQLEKEWEEEQEKKRRAMMGEDVSDEENYEVSDDDDTPWACLICREDFVNPVVTRCKHYFCERCALDHYVSSTRCHTCDEQTHGIFNTATRLLENLDKKKAKREAEKEKLKEDVNLKQEFRETEGWAIPKG